MHWVFAKNLYSSSGNSDLDRSVAALDELGSSYSLVKLVPIFGVFDPEFDAPAGKIIAMGSTTMIRVAIERGWKPGVFFNDSFRFESWLKGYGRENLFNGDAKVMRFADVVLTTEMFVRPCEDLKSFTGFVAKPDEWSKWKEQVLQARHFSEHVQIEADTPVIVAEPRTVFREYRFFVVGGQVVSGSQYRTANGLDITPDIDLEPLNFAQAMATRWGPADVYALDIAEDARGFKVLEVNCFNGAGPYAANLVKVFGAIERFFQ